MTGLGWGAVALTQLVKMALTKGVPWLLTKMKSIVKKKQGEEVLDDIVPKASLQIEHKPPSDARIDKTVEKATAGEKAKDVRDIDPAIVEKRIGNLEKKRDKELTRIGNREKAELLKKHGVAEDNTRTGGYFYTHPPGMTQEELGAAYLQTSKKYEPMKEAARKKWKKKMEPLYEELDEANRFYKGEMKKKYEYSAETEKILGTDLGTLREDAKLYANKPNTIYSYIAGDEPPPAIRPNVNKIQSRIEDFDVLKKRFNKDKRVLEIEKRFQQVVAKAGEDFMEGGNEALFHKRLAEAKKKKLKEMEKVLIELSEETDRFFHTRKITKLARGGLVENKVNYALNQWK